MTEWEIHGVMFTNCSCAYGCPCQFNALPTYGHCHAVCFLRVDEGHFGEARLDGLKLGFAIAWPGAVHQGHGMMQPIIDERGDAAQRTALLSILTGKETDPMATVFAIYTAMSDTIIDPIHASIAMEVDLDGRRATCRVEGVAVTRGEPVLNPVTKKELRAAIVLPNGSEYGKAEVGRGWSESFGTVEMTLADTHAHWCEVHMNQHGRIK